MITRLAKEAESNVLYSTTFKGRNKDLIEDVSSRVRHLEINTSEEIVCPLFEHDIIAWDILDLGPADVPIFHSFQLMNQEPIFHRPRRQPLKWNEVIKENVDNMLEGGIIVPTSSP